MWVTKHVQSVWSQARIVHTSKQNKATQPTGDISLPLKPAVRIKMRGEAHIASDVWCSAAHFTLFLVYLHVKSTV
jgi:hypothetical protein